MGKNEVIDIVREYKKHVLSAMGPASVYLFGSYSKDCAHGNSDIDVAVVVPEVKGDFIKTSSVLWGLTWNVNTLIEPVLIDARYKSPLYYEIINTGILI